MRSFGSSSAAIYACTYIPQRAVLRQHSATHKSAGKLTAGVQDGGEVHRDLYQQHTRLRDSDDIADYPIIDGTVLWIMPAPLQLAPCASFTFSDPAHDVAPTRGAKSADVRQRYLALSGPEFSLI